ncbi:MAG: sulfatase-like hydrolase/transferase, partial [Hyphomicrobiaceae bacterium]
MATVSVAERSVERLVFAASALAALAAMILLLVGDLERATALAGLIAVAIIGASRVKHHHSGTKLTVADFALVFAGTIPFLLKQYTRAALLVLAAATCLAVVAFMTTMYLAGPELAFVVRVACFMLASVVCVSIYWMSGGARTFRPQITQTHGYISTFTASFIEAPSWWPSRDLRLIDLADEPLPLVAATPERHNIRPDIIVIQHESVFDPRLYGLTIGSEIEAFLSPPNGLSGALKVGIYGGGSWQSEFSVLTGLASAAFGPDAYFIFKKGAGRFHHSLPHSLSALGYKTMLVASCRRNFMSYDAFYRSIGMDECVFSDDLSPPFDVDHFEQTYTDAIFLPAAIEAITKRLSHDQSPRFLYALTNFNHGPHGRGATFDDCSEVARALAHQQSPDPQYVDYYARLTETAANWRATKVRLLAENPGRAMLIVHYGDHQPVMTRRLERGDKLELAARRQFQTFYAIEGLNYEMDRSLILNGANLEIESLGT